MVVVGNKVTDSWRRYVEEGIGDPCLFLLLPGLLNIGEQRSIYSWTLRSCLKLPFGLTTSVEAKINT